MTDDQHEDVRRALSELGERVVEALAEETGRDPDEFRVEDSVPEHDFDADSAE